MNSSDNPIQVNVVPASEGVPEDPKDFPFYLNSTFNRHADAINGKESALYPLREVGCFKQYFTTATPFEYRNVYRFLMDVRAEEGSDLTAGNTYTNAHGVNAINTPTLITGTATTTDATPQFIPMPFVSTTAAENIQIHATSTDIVVTMGASAPTLSQAYVLFEYTKN